MARVDRAARVAKGQRGSPIDVPLNGTPRGRASVSNGPLQASPGPGCAEDRGEALAQCTLGASRARLRRCSLPPSPPWAGRVARVDRAARVAKGGRLGRARPSAHHGLPPTPQGPLGVQGRSGPIVGASAGARRAAVAERQLRFRPIVGRFGGRSANGSPIWIDDDNLPLTCFKGSAKPLRTYAPS